MVGWSKLIDLQTNQLQCVGLAFAKIAIRIQHEQDTMPSILTLQENAFYRLFLSERIVFNLLSIC